MRETHFIRQNRDKWEELEQALDGQQADPEKLSRLFVQTTDDLSYSRTFYPNRSVRVYLNGLAQRIFLRIYRSAPAPVGRLWDFWTDELPQIVYESRRAFRLSLALFVGAMAIGMLSCAMDPEFAEVILGADYVEMTRANIQSGDPLAVYKQRGEFGMFLAITMNNIFVAFLTFGMGIFFGVGAMVILLSNGIMVGAFQYFFVEYDLLQESFLTIWIHGTLELSSIVIAGAAGITMGNGLAFPGTYTRLQSFQRSARRGLKIMLGTVPLFVLAGFFESYLTRQTETPDVVRALFIVLCLTFVLFYFVWYPVYRQRRGRATAVTDTRIPPDRHDTLDFGSVKTAGEVMTEVFILLRQYGGLLLGGALLVTLGYTLLAFTLAAVPFDQLYTFRTGFGSDFWNVSQLYALRNGGRHVPLIAWLAFSILAALAVTAVERERGAAPPGNTLIRWLHLLPATALLTATLALPAGWSLLAFALLGPFLLLWIYAGFSGEGRWSTVLQYSLDRLGPVYALLGILLVMGLLFFSVLDTLVVELVFDIANWIIDADQVTLDKWSILLMTAVIALIANLIWLMMFLGYGLLFHSLREIREARHLRQRIQELGRSRTLRGLAREVD